jgi:DNA-binding transcriptional LysR family regulator
MHWTREIITFIRQRQREGMDLKQIENIIVIYDERSIAKAADKLFKLEKELGALLFERRYHEMIPTFAGRVYIDAARKMVGMKQETYKIIKDISGGTSGEISIAYTPERGSKVFCNVYPVFHREYPDFQVKTFEARVPKAKELLFRHEVTSAGALGGQEQRRGIAPD